MLAKKEAAIKAEQRRKEMPLKVENPKQFITSEYEDFYSEVALLEQQSLYKLYFLHNDMFYGDDCLFFEGYADLTPIDISGIVRAFYLDSADQKSPRSEQNLNPGKMNETQFKDYLDILLAHLIQCDSPSNDLLKTVDMEFLVLVVQGQTNSELQVD